MEDTDFVTETNVLFLAPYATSKAALNLTVTRFQVQYHEEIIYMAIAPGRVDTGGYDSSGGKQLSLNTISGAH